MEWFWNKKEESKKELRVRELSNFQKELAEKAQAIIDEKAALEKAIIDEKAALEKARRDTITKEVREQIQTLLRECAERGDSFIESKTIMHKFSFSVRTEESEICWRIKECCDELGIYRKDYPSHSWHHTIYLIPPK